MPRVTPLPYTQGGWNVLDLPDGTTHVWKTYSASNLNWTAVSPLYLAVVSDNASYPFAFEQAPRTWMDVSSIIGASGAAIGGMPFLLPSNTPRTKYPAMRVARTSNPEKASITVTVHAVGVRASS